MSMHIDMIWNDDDSIRYRAGCTRCSFVTSYVEDEDRAAAAWQGHRCR